MRVHRTLFNLICLLLANAAYADSKPPACAVPRTLSLRTQAKDTKTIHIDLGDVRQSDAQDFNLVIPDGPYIVKSLAAELKKHPEAHRFTVEWSISGITSQREYGLAYDRRKHNLAFLKWGFISASGISMIDHFWYTRVNDRQILAVAARKKLSSPVVEHTTVTGPDSCNIEDQDFVPWLNELRRMGCGRRKLKFSVQAMRCIRVSDAAH